MDNSLSIREQLKITEIVPKSSTESLFGGAYLAGPDSDHFAATSVYFFGAWVAFLLKLRKPALSSQTCSIIFQSGRN